jgi:hypothetical protein
MDIKEIGHDGIDLALFSKYTQVRHIKKIFYWSFYPNILCYRPFHQCTSYMHLFCRKQSGCAGSNLMWTADTHRLEFTLLSLKCEPNMNCIWSACLWCDTKDQLSESWVYCLWMSGRRSRTHTELFLLRYTYSSQKPKKNMISLICTSHSVVHLSIIQLWFLHIWTQVPY